MKSDYTQRRNLEQQQALKDQQRKTQITEKPERVYFLWFLSLKLLLEMEEKRMGFKTGKGKSTKKHKEKVSEKSAKTVIQKSVEEAIEKSVGKEFAKTLEDATESAAEKVVEETVSTTVSEAVSTAIDKTLSLTAVETNFNQVRSMDNLD